MAVLVQTTLFVLENLDSVQSTTNIGQPSDDNMTPVDKVNLSHLSLFGRVERRNTMPIPVDAPETKLDLKLQGIFTAEDPENSAAIIKQRDKSDLYQIGDRISGNAVLAAVNNDHILIRRGSRLEKLLFNPDYKGVPPVTRDSPRTTVNRENPDPGRQGLLNRQNEQVSQSSPGSLIRQYAETNRELINQDPASALSGLGMTPVEEDEAKGYQLGSSTSNPLLQQTGLQPGDVILTVNGKPVGVAMNDSALVEQALEEKVVRVEVQRDSRKFFLTVPIPQE